MSWTESTKVRVIPEGSEKKAKNSLECERSLSRTTLSVADARGASPESRFPRLVPPTASRPLPVLARRSISAVSATLLETISAPRSFSYQRKAGMFSLLPSSRPAWLAPVWLERSHSQPTIRWLPSASQRAIVGTWPESTASRRTCSPSPSISKKITPGTSVSLAPRDLRIRRRTTRR